MNYPMPGTRPLKNPPVEYVDVVGDFMFRSINLEMGQVVPQHVHEVDHVTVVGSGKVRFWKNGQWQRDVEAFGVIEVKAGDEHLFQALREDTKMSCVFNTATEGFKKFMGTGE